jgi:hypothetical protein
MRRVLNWIGIVMGGLIALALITGVVLYIGGNGRHNIVLYRFGVLGIDSPLAWDLLSFQQ